MDFTTNYIVIGEFATAAGLSTYNLIAGPLFYLAHEAAWNYLGPDDDAVDLTAGAREANGAQGGLSRFTISRALAKTITFRVIASTMDFATNYFVVRDVGSALILSASGFILGPFVYFGHEKAWEYFSEPPEGSDLPPLKLLPAPRCFRQRIFTAGRDMLGVTAPSTAAHRHRYAEYRDIAVYV